MSPQRLSDRYALYALQPNNVAEDAGLVALMEANGVHGSVFHILGHVPEQGEDEYVVLVDDRSVVEFEVPRGTPRPVAEEFHVSPLADYRRKMGQGKARIRLDQAADTARKLLMAKRPIFQEQ